MTRTKLNFWPKKKFLSHFLAYFELKIYWINLQVKKKSLSQSEFNGFPMNRVELWCFENIKSEKCFLESFCNQKRPLCGNGILSHLTSHLTQNYCPLYHWSSQIQIRFVTYSLPLLSEVWERIHPRCWPLNGSRLRGSK